MKWIRFGLVPVLVLTLASAALADDKTETKSAPAKHGDWNKSPEEMSKDALAKWQGVLKLTDEQKPQFESIMKDSYEKMAEDRKDAAGDHAKMKASMQSNMSDRETALAKVLTPDQMKIYREKMEKMKSEAKKKWDKDAKSDSKDSAKEDKK